MKKIIVQCLSIVLFAVIFSNSSKASFDVSETWNADLRSQVVITCDEYSRLCIDLCNNTKLCYLKNSTCRDCISTGVKMTYFFSAFGKEISGAKEEVSQYEFVEFLSNESFIAIGPNNIYNQFDAAQTNALLEKFKSMCPNNAPSPVAFFKIENKNLIVKNAKYITCGSAIYRLEVKSVLLD